MPRPSLKFKVYLELGQKRVFAGAMDWPGWCRSGRDEASALEALYEAGPRYARVLRSKRLGFKAAEDVSAFVIVERLKGNATTDFGAPDASPSEDAKPVPEAELKRFQTILRACWRALDAAAREATGHTLRTGPWGGGRGLEALRLLSNRSQQCVEAYVVGVTLTDTYTLTPRGLRGVFVISRLAAVRPGRYPWLKGYSLAFILLASHDLIRAS